MVTFVSFGLYGLPSSQTTAREKNKSKATTSRTTRNGQISSQMLEAKVEAASQVSCPTNHCHCTNDTKTNRILINCRYMKLQAIPPFTKMDTLFHKLDCSESNYIKELELDAFKNLKVQIIDLLNNQLSDIQPGSFNGLETYLQELLIEGNGIIPVPYDKIQNLKNLKLLKLKKFQQTIIGEVNTFGFYEYLEAFEMEDFDTLTSIDKLAFQNKLQALVRLCFTRVSLSQIPVDSLKYLQSLQNLCIKESKITTIYNQSFASLRNLKQLELTHNNKLSEIHDDAFAGISNHLKLLDLGSNDIKPGSLKALSNKFWNNLETFTLSYNLKLDSLPDNVFKNMPKLQYLYLVGINLKKITRNMLKGLHSLNGLDLQYNYIEVIEDQAFQDTYSLTELKLDYQFYEINGRLSMHFTPQAFNGLGTSLLIFSIENTRLIPEQFWNAIRVFKELQELVASNANLPQIPEFAFINNKKLKTIVLNKNSITQLPDAAFRGLEDVLYKVLLESNMLENISQCVFSNFTVLDYIQLRDNPLNCDCTLKWLHAFLHEKAANLDYNHLVNDYQCTKPSIHSNQILYNIQDLHCVDKQPAPCSNQTFTSTPTGQASTQPSVPYLTTSKPTSNGLKLSIVSTSQHSLTIAWKVDKMYVTGFKIEYRITTDLKTQESFIHRDEFIYTIINLQSATFYNVCVTAEVNMQVDPTKTSCLITQTLSINNGAEHNNQIDNQADSRNVIIGAVIATVAVLILIAVGICAIVKYKMQMFKAIATSYPYERHQQHEGTCKDYKNKNTSSMLNVYNEIGNAKISNKHRMKTTKQMQRQFIGEEKTQTDVLNEPYSTYYKIGRHRRNPYENDDEDELVHTAHINPENNAVYFKPDLESRHSAPSRMHHLSAKDLMKQAQDRNSRPLPVAPVTDLQNKSAATDRKICTQASVYATKPSAT